MLGELVKATDNFVEKIKRLRSGFSQGVRLIDIGACLDDFIPAKD